jgi:hypothetical protein
MSQVRWTTTIPGVTDIRVAVDPDDESVYVSDGWGIAYASLRLRRLSLANGKELASVRLGDAVRCVAFSEHQSELVAATARMLFVLDRASLEVKERWRRRVPTVSDSLIRKGNLVLMANWLRPTLGLFNLWSRNGSPYPCRGRDDASRTSRTERHSRVLPKRRNRLASVASWWRTDEVPEDRVLRRCSDRPYSRLHVVLDGRAVRG